MDPCGALCLRQLVLPNHGIDNLSITEFLNLNQEYGLVRLESKI